MKTKFNTNLLVSLIIAVVVLVVCWPLINTIRSYFAPKTVARTLSTSIFNGWVGHVEPIDPELDQNLSYREYTRLKDSITTMRSLRDGDYATTNSIIISGVIGITYYRVCDTCSLKFYREKFTDGRTRAFIALPGWTLNTYNWLNYADEGKFYVKNNQAYVRKALLDTSYKTPDGAMHNRIRMADMPVKFRYNHKDKFILIPITNAQAQILNALFYICFGGMLFYFFYLLAAFLAITVDTSKGEIFTDKNISRLRIIAFSLLAIPIIIYAFNYLLKFIFHEYFISGVVAKNNLIPNLWIYWGLSLIFLLLYRSFRQGRILKDEHDLTV